MRIHVFAGIAALSLTLGAGAAEALPGASVPEPLRAEGASPLLRHVGYGYGPSIGLSFEWFIPLYPSYPRHYHRPHYRHHHFHGGHRHFRPYGYKQGHWRGRGHWKHRDWKRGHGKHGHGRRHWDD